LEVFFSTVAAVVPLVDCLIADNKVVAALLLLVSVTVTLMSVRARFVDEVDEVDGVDDGVVLFNVSTRGRFSPTTPVALDDITTDVAGGGVLPNIAVNEFSNDDVPSPFESEDSVVDRWNELHPPPDDDGVVVVVVAEIEEVATIGLANTAVAICGADDVDVDVTTLLLLLVMVVVDVCVTDGSGRANTRQLATSKAARAELAIQSSTHNIEST
jgi:hypothetical protein